MSVPAFTLDVRDTVTPVLQRLGRALTGAEFVRLKKQIGTAVAALVADNFATLASSRHRPDSPRNFYADAARAVRRDDAVQPIPDGVKIAIDHQGIAQRYFGGPIPESGDAKDPVLAIPAPGVPEVAGRRAAEVFDVLHLIFSPIHGPHSIGALVQKVSSLGNIDYTPIKSGPNKGNMRISSRSESAVTVERVMYWLVPSVHQEPDPTVLPTEEKMMDAATDTATDYIDRLIAGGAQ